MITYKNNIDVYVQGALAGLVSSLLVLGWIKVGSILHPSSRGRNSLSVAECLSPTVNATTLSYDATAPWMETTNPLFDFMAVESSTEGMSR